MPLLLDLYIGAAHDLADLTAGAAGLVQPRPAEQTHLYDLDSVAVSAAWAGVVSAAHAGHRAQSMREQPGADHDVGLPVPRPALTAFAPHDSIGRSPYRLRRGAHVSPRFGRPGSGGQIMRRCLCE